VAICCSTSLGLALEGELGAILLRAAEDMLAGCDIVVGFVEGKGREGRRGDRKTSQISRVDDNFREWMVVCGGD
jgi:hypothetical protein